jgi:signal recognition particle subunit SRP54
MFQSLSERLGGTLEKLRGIGRLTESNIQDTLLQIRKALIEGDVAQSVIDEFLLNVKQKALGTKTLKSISPGDALVKIVHEEIKHALGEVSEPLDLAAQPPVVILMCGLQGTGKTTTVAKLAHYLQTVQKKKVSVVSTDTSRPAAIDQLETLAEQVNARFYPSHPSQQVTAIAKAAMADAKLHFMDVLIIDTAGRLSIDQALMQELAELKQTTHPQEVLLVVDAMTGQEAANTAKTFHDAIGVTGMVLTKADGDARGGAALSIRLVTGKPIKLMGTGEKIDNFEVFHPNRIASSILGMGDIVSLVEKAQQTVDKEEAKKLSTKIKKGMGFNYNDFLSQLNQMQKMGGLAALMKKMPMMPKGTLASGLMDDQAMTRMQSIILSMTLKERKFPALLNTSRKIRIAKGSGTDITDVNKLVKQFGQMQKTLKKVSGDKMQKRMKQLQQMKSKLPPGFLDQLPTDFM